MAMFRRPGPWIALLLIALGISAPGWMGAYYLGVFTTAYYFGVFAMSWDLLFGFAGEVNFGPTFMIGVGAYTAGTAEQCRLEHSALPGRRGAWPR